MRARQFRRKVVELHTTAAAAAAATATAAAATAVNFPLLQLGLGRRFGRANGNASVYGTNRQEGDLLLLLLLLLLVLLLFLRFRDGLNLEAAGA
jgi:hypothetical protein